MGSFEDARLKLGQALGLRANKQVMEANLRFSEAESLLKRAMTEGPPQAQVYYTYARLLTELKRYSEAETEYERALNLDSTDSRIKDDYEKMRKRRQAAEFATIPLTPEPEIPSSPIELEENVPEVLPETPSPAPDMPLTDEPETVEASSQEADGYWALGVLKVEQDDVAGGEEAFQQALHLAPRHARTLTAYSLLLLNQQRYSEAEEYLALLAEVDPPAVERYFAGQTLDSNPDLLALQGLLYARQNELEAARPFLAKALELVPNQVTWAVAYIRSLTGPEHRHKAITWLQAAFARGLEEAALHREYAGLLAKQGQFDEVDRHLKRALLLDPNDVETQELRDQLQPRIKKYNDALRRMALALIKARDASSIKEAEALFEEALQIDSDHLPTLKAYATFLEQRGRFSDAERMWAMVALKTPEEAEAHFQAILDARGENSETLNGLARVLIQLGLLPQAEARLSRSLALAADNAEMLAQTLQLLAEILEKQGRYHDVAKLLGNNLTTVKANAKLSLRYAQFLAARRDYEEAKEFYHRAQELAPSDADIAVAWTAVKPRIDQFDRANLDMAWGWQQARLGNLAEAEQSYQQALAIDPGHRDTLSRYAQFLEEDGRSMEASSYLLRLAQFDPEAAEKHYQDRLPQLEHNIEGRCAYALLLQHLGRLAEAKEQFRLALAIQPAYLPALKPYLDLALQAGELREAELSLQHALADDDQIAELHWRYGNLLFRRHRYGLAGPKLKRAMELAGDTYKEAYDRLVGKLDQAREAELAWAWARQISETEPLEAESAFKEALAACSDHIPTLLDYSDFLQQQGRREEALVYLAQALEFDPYDERAVQLRNTVEGMSPEPHSPSEERLPVEDVAAETVQPQIQGTENLSTPPDPGEDMTHD